MRFIEPKHDGSSPRLWGTDPNCLSSPAKWRFIPTPVGSGLGLIYNAFTSTGSSPRLWGTASSSNNKTTQVRFIPTPVGNGISTFSRAWQSAVHPHACGERHGAMHTRLWTHGSSPRLWGTAGNVLDGCKLIRFIPTPVGNGCRVRPYYFQWPVHPHACGERVITNVAGQLLAGSSPRLWGTAQSRNRPSRPVRFIPTPVGNGLWAPAIPSGLSVHPHACGERELQMTFTQLDTGSSPRLWGTVLAHLGQLGVERFIPTPVGNGPRTTPWGASTTVHPHACGERPSHAHQPCGPRGSSPRLWGTDGGSPGQALLVRFIPTPVGNGRTGLRESPRRSVHPHACGERTKEEASMYRENGSSPRLWGTGSVEASP